MEMNNGASSRYGMNTPGNGALGRAFGFRMESPVETGGFANGLLQLPEDTGNFGPAAGVTDFDVLRQEYAEHGGPAPNDTHYQSPQHPTQGE